MSLGQDLADFLLARIAEDEAVTQAAKPGPWHWDDEYGPMLVTATPRPQVPSGNYEDTAWRAYYDAWGARAVAQGTAADEYGAKIEIDAADASHIARHDPARVLAECTAKRKIVEELRTVSAHADTEYDSGRVCAFTASLLLLADVYADHPDYEQTWRP